MARYRIQDLDRDLLELVKEEVSDEGRSRILAATATNELRDAQTHNRMVLGVLPPHRSWVDGMESANFAAVRPDGIIAFEFELYDYMFEEIGNILLKHSPVQQEPDPRPGHPGLYRGSHLFLADGRPVPAGAPTPLADEYIFVSSVPYARKIENGLSDQAPDGVYETVAHLAMARFGNLANIRFNWRSLSYGDLEAWASTTQMQPRNNKTTQRARADWLRRQPSIIIRPA